MNARLEKSYEENIKKNTDFVEKSQLSNFTDKNMPFELFEFLE